jgi:glycosyltransferase involved in cell wall biosynthesis
MALGCPVILSDVSSLPEIASPESAIFVDPLSTPSIVEAMKTIVSDPVRTTSLVAEGKQNAARFTYENYLQNMLESMKEL